jgi:uncharacterized C2H2 Zn-finger protein
MVNYIIVECPHCKNMIYIEKKDFNCHIFRHGILKATNKQIGPHLDKASCDNLKKKDLIYGCSKPFKLIQIDNNYKTIICDYI